MYVHNYIIKWQDAPFRYYNFSSCLFIPRFTRKHNYFLLILFRVVVLKIHNQVSNTRVNDFYEHELSLDCHLSLAHLVRTVRMSPECCSQTNDIQRDSKLSVIIILRRSTTIRDSARKSLMIVIPLNWGIKRDNNGVSFFVPLP